MPAYPYVCKDCGREFDIIKRVSDIDQVEVCECGSENTYRTIALVSIDKTSAAQPYYEPALGCVIKSKQHKSRILKQRGLEEIGNTNPDTLYKDNELRKQKERDREWEAL